MLDSQQKRKASQIMYHKVTLVTMAIFAVFVLHFTWVVHGKKIESDELKNTSLKYNQGLEKRQTELVAQTERLNTEVGKEAEIRLKFSVAKEKENIVVIVDDTPATNTPIEEKSFWQRITDLFN